MKKTVNNPNKYLVNNVGIFRDPKQSTTPHTPLHTIISKKITTKPLLLTLEKLSHTIHRV